MQESLFYRIAKLAQRHSMVVFVVITIVSVVLGYFALKIRLNADIRTILPNRPQAMAFAEQTGELFSSEALIVAAESPAPLEAEKLVALASAASAMQKLPHVVGVMSPFNWITLARIGGRVVPAMLGPAGGAPATAEELAAFKERISTDPLARNMVISKDGTTLACIVVVEAQEDYGELLRGVQAAVEPLRGHYAVRLAGGPALFVAADKYLRRDVPRLLGGAVLVVLAVFFFGFGSKRSFFLPLLVVGLGAVWTTGIMALLGYDLSLVSLMVPPLVLILGSSYSIHVLTQYYRDAEQNAQDTAWIPKSVTRIVQTVFLAAATTVFGFLGLLTADIRQIRQFGIAASIGITLCAVLALFFFPAVLGRLRPPRERDRERVEYGASATFMGKLGGFVAKWRRAVLVALVLVVAGFALVVGQLRYDTNYVGYFRSREAAVEDTRFVIRKFGGYVSVRLTLSAPNGEKGYFLKPEALRSVARLESRLAESPDVSYISSFTSYLAAYTRALGEEPGVPAERAPILAFGRLFRGAMASALGKELLGELADPDFTRLTLVLRTYDSRRGDLMYEKSLGEFAGEAQDLAVRTVGSELTPVVWGPTMVAVEVSQRLAQNQISSSLISAGLILLLTAVSFRSIKYGLYTVIPTVAGIFLSFIVMVAFSIPLDIVTVMFTSVALGLGVDSSIHVVVKYREQRRTSEDLQVVLRNTLRTAGRPILHTGASLISGLLVLLASGFLPIAFFGLLLSLAIVTTAAGSLVFLPAILATEMVISRRRKERRPAP